MRFQAMPSQEFFRSAVNHSQEKLCRLQADEVIELVEWKSFDFRGYFVVDRTVQAG